MAEEGWQRRCREEVVEEGWQRGGREVVAEEKWQRRGGRRAVAENAPEKKEKTDIHRASLSV